MLVEFNSPQFIEAIRLETGQLLTVRQARIGDIDAIASLVNRAYMYENEGETAFKRENDLRTTAQHLAIDLRTSVIMLAINPGSSQIYGCVQYKEVLPTTGSGSDQDRNAYFGMLTVDPNFQGRGYGNKLLTLAEELGRARGRHFMEIQVVDHSTHLLDQYGRLGYKEFARVDAPFRFATKPTQFVKMVKSLQSPAASAA